MAKQRNARSTGGGLGWLLGLGLGIGAIGAGVWSGQSWLLGRSPDLLQRAQQATQRPTVDRLTDSRQQLTQQIGWLQLIPNGPGFAYEAAQAQLSALQVQATRVDRALRIAQGLKQAETAAMEAAKVVQNPPHPPAIWQQAKQHWQRAIQALEALPKDGADGMAAQAKLAAYRQNLGAIEQQLAVALQAVEFNNRGVQELSAGRYREAIAWFQQAIAQNAKMAEAHLGQGLAQMGLQDYRSALGSFDRAVAANEDFPDAYLYRGEVRYEFGDAPGAIADLDRTIALDAKRAAAYLLRGAMHMDQNQFDQARPDLRKAADLFSEERDLLAASQARSLLDQLPTPSATRVAVIEPEPEPTVDSTRRYRSRSSWSRVRSFRRRGRR